MKNGNNRKESINIHERLVRLETQMKSILTNHLPHIQKAIDKLSTKFWAVILLLLSNLVGLVIALALIIFK